MEKIQVFMASDDGYAPYLTTALYSLFVHTKCGCVVHIFDGNLSSLSKKKILTMAQSFPNAQIDFIPVDRHFFENLPIIQHFSINTYFRYLIADVNPDLKKALWIDCDMLVTDDIGVLWDIDLKDKCLGAVPYLYENKKYQKTDLHKGTILLKRKLDLPINHQYFNAGLLLLNLKYWRKNNWTRKLFDLTVAKKDIIECADQDILNILAQNNYLILPDTFNSVVDINYILKKKLKKLPKIIHFTGGNSLRPWIAKNCPYRELYYSYALETPFKDFFLEKEKTLIPVTVERENKYGRLIRFFFQKKITKSGRLSIKICKIPLPAHFVKELFRKLFNNQVTQSQTKSSNSAKIPIVFAFDDRYALPASIAFKTLMESKNKRTEYEVIVFHTGLKDETIQKMETICPIRWIKVDSTILKDAPIGYSGLATYFRLLIADLLPEYDKVIWSDVDVFFKGDLSDIYHQDMQEADWGGIRAEKWDEKNGIHKHYPNNKRDIFLPGFMLVNAKQWREKKMLDRFLKIIKSEKLKFFDLDVLNLAADKIMDVPFHYCVLENIYDFDEIEKTHEYPWLVRAQTREALIAAKKNPIIIHYASDRTKIWKRRKEKIPPYYWQYIEKSPFYRVEDYTWSIKQEIRLLALRLIKPVVFVKPLRKKIKQKIQELKERKG